MGFTRPEEYAFLHGGQQMVVAVEAGMKGAGQAVERAAILIEGKWKRKLSQPGRGVVYRRRGVTHQASAPGDPPAVDTGLLRQSISHRRGVEGGNPVAYVGTDDKRGVWLEFGTRNIQPRPSLRPAVEESLPEVRSMIALAYENAQRGASKL